MATALQVFKARQAFKVGRQKDSKLMSRGYVVKGGAPAGLGSSLNKDLGSYLNRCFFTLHHDPGKVPQCVEGLRGWLRDRSSRGGYYITGDEQFSRHIYGEWNTRNLVDAEEFCRFAGANDLAYDFQRRVENLQSVYWLASLGNRTAATGDRSWVVAGRDQGYYDVKGRWRRPYALGKSGLDAYLRRGVVEDLVRDLRRGPYFERPFEILKTSKGVAFCLNKTRGGSTPPLPAYLIVEDPSSFEGPWEQLRFWGVTPKVGWLSTDPPRRKVGRVAVSGIRRTGDQSWTIWAQSRDDKDYYDTWTQAYRKGRVEAVLRGKLIYHIRANRDQVDVDFPGGSIISPPPEGKRSWLGKLIEKFVEFFDKLF